MFSKKVKSRIFFLSFFFFIVALIVFFILKSLEDNVVYFFSPTEIYNKSDISLSITGVAGPKGGTKKKPVGLVYIGIKKGNKTLVRKFLFKNKKRSQIQRTTVNKALNLILSFAK